MRRAGLVAAVLLQANCDSLGGDPAPRPCEDVRRDLDEAVEALDDSCETDDDCQLVVEPNGSCEQSPDAGP